MPHVTMISRANRTGEFITNAFTIPGNVTGSVAVSADINTNDLTDPTKSATIIIEISKDAGQAWEVFAAFTWQGNSNQRQGRPVDNPSLGTYEVSRFAGFQVRARCIVPVAVRIGLVLDYL